MSAASTEAATLRAIENNKNKTDLSLALNFVTRHKALYAKNIGALLDGKEFPESRAIAEGVAFENFNPSGVVQITTEDTKRLIAHVSPHLLKLSNLKTVDFKWQEKVAVPNFGADGNLNPESRCAGIVPMQEFADGKHHPQRMLIGCTAANGETIWPTAVPQTVSKDAEAVWYYQLHVMLHELFHTIEMTRRNDEAAGKIILNAITGRTFTDWGNDYLNSLATEHLLTSEYSSIYAGELFESDTRKIRPDVTPYSDPVREDMAEAWVAGHFDIISNPHGYQSFKKYPFGNGRNLDEARITENKGMHSRRAALIKELLTSGAVHTDKI